ncbi:hypothetical protein D3C72_1695560 [compost metagenome]
MAPDPAQNLARGAQVKRSGGGGTAGVSEHRRVVPDPFRGVTLAQFCRHPGRPQADPGPRRQVYGAASPQEQAPGSRVLLRSPGMTEARALREQGGKRYSAAHDHHSLWPPAGGVRRSDRGFADLAPDPRLDRSGRPRPRFGGRGDDLCPARRGGAALYPGHGAAGAEGRRTPRRHGAQEQGRLASGQGAEGFRPGGRRDGQGPPSPLHRHAA